MQDKIYVVDLEPLGVGAFKTPLRSDTIWGALCWAIRLIHGNPCLERLLKAYKDEPQEAFFLSSAFPYKVEEDGNKVRYFEYPLLPFFAEKRIDTEDLTPWEIKKESKKIKMLKGQKKGYVSQARFESLLDGGKVSLSPNTAPAIISRAFTHNTIDRITGSTLVLNESGQLYHTDELFITEKFNRKKHKFRPTTHLQNGLFFLLRANDSVLDILKGALRFLAHFGIGGDRSIGKGRFKITEPEEFEIAQPKDANAKLNLSLYAPRLEELNVYQKSQDKYLLNYRLEDRWGRTQWQPKDVRHDHAFLFFRAGSVFPKIASLEPYFGHNPCVGKHAGNFDIYRYGHAFMLDIKIAEG